MSTDSRVKYTKSAIEKSFLHFLEKKPVRHITVREICERAQINRSTFYRYYRDSYDVLDQMEQRYLDELKEIVETHEQMPLQDTMKPVMEKMKEDKDVHRVLFSDNGDVTFPSKLINMCFGFAMREARRAFPDQDENVLKWMYYFLAQGCQGMLSGWAKDGFPDNIDEVLAYMDIMNDAVIRKVTGSHRAAANPVW